MTTGLTGFAGQWGPSGVDADAARQIPLNALDAPFAAPAQTTINGLALKIGRTIIEETKIFQNPLEGLIVRDALPFGVAVETAAFQTGPPNKLVTSCIPQGNAPAVSQLSYGNWGYNVEISVYDREINRAVIDAETAGAYYGQKMRTPLKTIAANRWQAWREMLGNVKLGAAAPARSITSSTVSDGSGTSVTYAVNPTTPWIDGAAKPRQVKYSGVTLPQAVDGTVTATPTASDVEGLEHVIEDLVAEWAYETPDFNLLGIDNFTTGKPALIMESKVVGALDHSIYTSANRPIPSTTFRQYISQFVDLYTTNSFVAPAGAPDTSSTHIAAYLLEPGIFREYVMFENVEPYRCVGHRSDNYSYQGEAALSAWKGYNAAVIMAND